MIPTKLLNLFFIASAMPYQKYAHTIFYTDAALAICGRMNGTPAARRTFVCELHL